MTSAIRLDITSDVLTPGQLLALSRRVHDQLQKLDADVELEATPVDIPAGVNPARALAEQSISWLIRQDLPRLVIDLPAGMIHRIGRPPVILTPNEGEVLHQLHAAHPVPIKSHCFPLIDQRGHQDTTRMASPAVVRAIIHRLRHALDEREWFLSNNSQVGYRLHLHSGIVLIPLDKK